MNRKPKMVRDKNYTFQQQQASQFETQQSYKEQKLQQITQHRKMAILGGKQEKNMLQTSYRDEAMKLIEYQEAKKIKQRVEEKAVDKRIAQKFQDDCNVAAQAQYQKRMEAKRIAQDNMNMAQNKQRQNMAFNVRDKLNEDDLIKQKKASLQNFIR